MNIVVTTPAHEFTEQDWYGFAGAELFEDGSAPVLLEAETNNDYISIVASKSGIDIFLYPKNHDSDEDVWMKDMSNDNKETIVNTISKVVNRIRSIDSIPEYLEAEGFDHFS